MKTTLAEILKQIAPLPYKKLSYHYIISGEDGIEHSPEARQKEEATAAYLVHAANELPKLVAYLKSQIHTAEEGDCIDPAGIRKVIKQATTIEL